MLTGLGILAVWIALQVWVLPRLGVPGGAVPNPRSSRGPERTQPRTDVE
jgi:hypothetical protein